MEFCIVLILTNFFSVAQNESVQVHLNTNEPPAHINQVNENDDENLMTVEVLGDMPKIVALDQESTFQV